VITDSKIPSRPADSRCVEIKPILLVGNPTSQSGKALKRIDLARKLLDKHELEHDFESTLPDGRTTQMVTKAIASKNYKTIIYLGGDGTFNEVAKGICASGVPNKICLGMLPAGTANDQGKSFGIGSAKNDLEKNVKIIKEGYLTTLDVGEVFAIDDSETIISRDLFFDSLGWGLSAAILAFRNRELQIVKKMPVWREMYRDHAVYVRAAMHELAINWLTRDRFAAEVIVDGEVHNLMGLSDLVVSNTVLYAGDWVIDENASHDDGAFEVAVFKGTRDWTSKLIMLHKRNPLTGNLMKKIGISYSPNFKGRDIRVQIFNPYKDKRLPAQIDGDEFLQADHFHVKVLPNLLNIIVPKNYRWI